jgi:succinate dehydrogenase/fumarate reductase-like Fe-S protein
MAIACWPLRCQKQTICELAQAEISEPIAMFETDKYDSALHRQRAALPQMNYEPVGNIDGMSFLLWAEHCVECAAPACYASCDLYQPRKDSRCRRFAFGAYKNTAFDSARGYGVEIRFKKMGKARGIWQCQHSTD